MQPNFCIRPARPNDAPVILEMVCALAAETEHKQLDRAVVTRGIERLLRDERAGFYALACEQETGAIAGCVTVTYEWSSWRAGFWWWIGDVYMMPSARRRGGWNALFEWLQTRCEAHDDCCGFRLYVEAENHVARGAYARGGFEAPPYVLMERERQG